MKNYEVYLKNIGLDKILREIADNRLRSLNAELFDMNSTSYGDYVCDNGEGFYWMSDAIEQEIKWLKQEAD